MARAQSAVLSAADKKAVVADLKTKVKEANDALKAHDKNAAAAAKAFAATVKANEKAATAADKARDKLLKAQSKAYAALEAATA